MRLHAQTAMIENGFVRILETAPWLDEYLHEMTVFVRNEKFESIFLQQRIRELSVPERRNYASCGPEPRNRARPFMPLIPRGQRLIRRRGDA
jgi:hypothetical protein